MAFTVTRAPNIKMQSLITLLGTPTTSVQGPSMPEFFISELPQHFSDFLLHIDPCCITSFLQIYQMHIHAANPLFYHISKWNQIWFLAEASWNQFVKWKMILLEVSIRRWLKDTDMQQYSDSLLYLVHDPLVFRGLNYAKKTFPTHS